MMQARILEKAQGMDRVKLLKEPSVIQWLTGDLSFLPPIETKNKTRDAEKYKVLEDAWGQSILGEFRPDLKKSGQWTTVVGEQLNLELQLLLGRLEYRKPVNKQGWEPDGETEDCIWEVKTQTYFTSGTAGEKILGVPFKYADVPVLYGKPLKIVCLAGAEKKCREDYGNLPGPKTTETQQKMLDFWQHEMQIEYIGATDLMKLI